MKVLMVGLPESGKSTYVAALFHTLKEGAHPGLSLRALPEEREYLLTLEKSWLALQPVGHSAHTGPRRIELALHDAGQNADLDVAIPDVSGEEFLQAWDTGEWSEPVAELLQGADGILLFIRANDVTLPELIEVGSTPSNSSAGQAPDWTPEKGVTQARVCDLLEQMTELREGLLPPVAVVVSAWDSVESEMTPSDWLRWRLPLLEQWLQATTPPVASRLFGISAQGGDVEDAAARQVLAQLPRIGRPGGAHELAAPLQWLLEAQ